MGDGMDININEQTSVSQYGEELASAFPGADEYEMLSPMMKLYVNTKKEYSECILFYRLGDFYEMFFDDALKVSKELELALTGKNCGLSKRAPMCGIPFHAVDGYITKLVEKGYRVAICEQMEDPRFAKGLVKRDVIRIVTPGTNLDSGSLEESKNNYLCCIFIENDKGKDIYGLSTVDISTGDFYVTQFDSVKMAEDEIDKYEPSELICSPSFEISGVDISRTTQKHNIIITELDEEYFDEEQAKKSLTDYFKQDMDMLGLNGYTAGIVCAGAIMKYLHDTQKNNRLTITKIIPYKSGRYMVIDSSTRRNLELTETMRNGEKKGTLLWVLDKTKTAMGARYLRNCTEQPLLDKNEINERLDAIEELNNNMVAREEIREDLNTVYDLERIMVKIGYKSANARDLLNFNQSIRILPDIKSKLGEMKSSFLKQIYNDLDDLKDLNSMISAGISEDAPLTLKEGGLIKKGYNAEVDELRMAKTDGKEWLSKLENDEKEKTGIKGLKIKYNNVFGYYFDVTNSYKNLVPDNWVRKQTTVNSERYTTPELKELESKILSAQDRLGDIEYELFSVIRDTVADNATRVQKTARAVAMLDTFASLSYVSEHNNYVRPSINSDGVINIHGGRHPVVEAMCRDGGFVANDVYLDNADNRISVITGPNMAGKSTYMRQCALIVIMAQIGSFVPAQSADISLTDRVFTRVGASDDLSSGQSTFMVEMTEVANILKNATRQSLLVLDEIGRGTSTFDGLAIAWAVTEYISKKNKIGAKTLFATHYHELTELEGKLNGVKNYNIAVKENGRDIIFLRKIVRGGADKSYGIQVARLAGLPEEVLNRATQLTQMLSDNDLIEKTKLITEIKDISQKSAANASAKKDSDAGQQLSLFSAEASITNREREIIEEIKMIDIDNLRGIEAIERLDGFKKKLQG